MIRTLLRDASAAARGYLRRPAFPLLLALVVAAGVAFLTTGHAVLDALLWRPLAFGSKSEFVMLGEARRGALPPMPRAGVDLWAAYDDAHERGRIGALESIVPLREADASLVVDGTASAEVVTWLLPGSMRALRTAPLFGRHPEDPDGDARTAREIAIGEDVWSRRFGRRPDALGAVVTLDGESAVVVGVMPRDFQFHRRSQVWAAWSRDELLADPQAAIPVVGRLAPGATRAQVARQVAPVHAAVAGARIPVDTASVPLVSAGPFGSELVPPAMAQLVLGTMVLVLLAACLNLATLFLARTRSRTPAYATRAALGAGRGGVLGLVTAEVVLVVLLGGVAGLALSALLVGWIGERMAGILPIWAQIRLDGRSVAASLGAMTLALLVVALPVVRLTRRLDLVRFLTQAGVIGRAPRHGKGAGALVATQVAVVLLLAAVAYPIGLSAARLAPIESGLDDRRVVRVAVSLGGPRYGDDEARDAYATLARARIERHPGVERAERAGGLDRWRVGETRWSDSVFTDAGTERVPGRLTFRIGQQVVSPGYFEAVGLRLLAGEGFHAGIAADGERVAIVGVSVAEALWPGETAIGRRFRRGADGDWIRVVGVVESETAIYSDWIGTTVEPRKTVYLSEAQATPQQMTLFVRARQDATPALVEEVRRLVAAVDPTQPVSDAKVLVEDFRFETLVRMWIAIVLGSGALAAVLLAMTGVFGLVSYYTAARLPELALRVALGASARGVALLVAGRMLRSIAVGVVLGSLLLVVAQRLVQRFVYDTSVFAPSVLAGVALLVILVAAVALLVPLRRLRRMSPRSLLAAD